MRLEAGFYCAIKTLPASAAGSLERRSVNAGVGLSRSVRGKDIQVAKNTNSIY